MFERNEISIFILAASMACTWSPAAVATEASPDLANSDQISEIIVTAQKRSERLNDVPMSITALTGERLQELQVLQVSDLSRVVPGFSYQPSDYGTPVYSIRGIGFKDVAVAVAPTVSVYVDQVPLPYSVETQGAAFDADRVEVLKGPQGTLFGQNSTGGAINFIAAKPTRTFDAGTDVTYGRFQETDVQGFVSGPLSDTFSGRIALRTEQRGDWQISETRPHDTLGNRNFSTGRALLDWQPNEVFKAELNISGWIDKSDTQAAQFVQYSPSVPNGYPDQTAALSVYQPAPNDARIADWKANTSLKRDDNFYQSSLNLQWAISEAVSLSSITAWSEFKQNAPTDTDGFNLGNFLMTIKAHIQSLSQEVRLSGTKANALHWMLGLNYEDDQSSDDQYGSDYGSNSGIGPLRWRYSDNSNHQTIDTKAAFGSLDYALTEAFTFQTSVRYTTANNDFHGCLRDPGEGGLATAFSLLTINAIQPGACVTLDPATGLSVPIVQKTLHEDNLSWRVGMNWKPDSDQLYYANATKGFKAGSFPTVPGLIPSQFDPIQQESVLAYEVGFKNALAHHSMELSGAIFYDDYRNKQLIGYVTTAFGNLPGLVGIPKSTVTGSELNLTWKPISGVDVTVGATYLDTKVTSDFTSNDPFNNPINLKGEAFPNASKWQFLSDVQYSFAISDKLSGFVGGNEAYRTATSAAFGNSSLFRLPAYGVLDLRAGFKEGNWHAEVWARNVADKFYSETVTHTVDTVSRLVGMPATYGITVGYRLK